MLIRKHLLIRKRSEAEKEKDRIAEQEYSRTLRALLGLLRFLWPTRVTGAVDTIPTDGCLICPNHLSFSDIPVLSSAFPQLFLRYMAKKELFRIPLLRGFMRKFGAYPVNRKNGDVGAIKTAISLLESGASCVIFPQGHRNPGVDPHTTVVHGGAALIARRAEVPIVPVYLKTKNRRSMLFRKTEVIVAPPILPEAIADYGADYDTAMRNIFSRTCDMEVTGRWS